MLALLDVLLRSQWMPKVAPATAGRFGFLGRRDKAGPLTTLLLHHIDTPTITLDALNNTTAGPPSSSSNAAVPARVMTATTLQP